ncbi:MAG TPA: hypothetical protein VFQ91_05870 [Bryobacteraceae bacterium]|nr:hypothetical protein [Bryobacteraceae bacterium]
MRKFGLIFLAAAIFLSGCSESPKPQTAKKEEPKKEPEPLSGRNAFFKVYVSARSWAPDVQCLNVTSIPLDEVKSQPGKVGAWQVTVVSPSKLRKRTYTWSAVEAQGNLHEGVFPGAEEPFNPNSKSKPFLIAALKTDTVDALKVAEEKSADYMKKNPDMRINYLLELGEKHPNPYWRVIWGESVGTSGHSVLVDATTGQYLETRH